MFVDFVLILATGSNELKKSSASKSISNFFAFKFTSVNLSYFPKKKFPVLRSYTSSLVLAELWLDRIGSCDALLIFNLLD